MGFWRSPQFRQFILIGSLGGMALLSGFRLSEYDTSPWGWVIIVTIGTVLLFGPAAWIIRDRIPEARREHLSYVATGIALLCVPLILGVGLLVGGLLFFLDVIVLGSVIGLGISSLVAQLIVPQRLRGAESR